MDVAGDNQLNIEHEMLKQRLKPNGQPEGGPLVTMIGQVGYGQHLSTKFAHIFCFSSQR